jgi:hypothetical protein
VLELGEGILGWVEGFPAGEPHRLGPSTREILALRIDRQDGLLEPAARSALGLPCQSARVATPQRSP